MTLSVQHREEKRILWAYKSIAYPYPEVKKVVRGWVNIGGFILEDLGGTKTDVTYISDADMKGDIPEFAKKSLSEEEGKLVGELLKLM